MQTTNVEDKTKTEDDVDDDDQQLQLLAVIRAWKYTLRLHCCSWMVTSYDHDRSTIHS